MSRNMASIFLDLQTLYNQILKSNLMDLDSPTQPWLAPPVCIYIVAMKI